MRTCAGKTLLAVCVPGFALTPEAGLLITREDSSERIWSLGSARAGDMSIFSWDTDVVDGKERCAYMHIQKPISMTSCL